MPSTSQQSFDYIVVGAGSAGCVLANRLSAEPNVSVALIEAGPSDQQGLGAAYIRTPAGIIRLIANPAFNWMHQFSAEEDLTGQPIHCPRGKVWGGSSAINGMIYMRGGRRDYDRWAELGNRGWSYDEVLPYFKRSEHFEPGESPWHGRGGPLNVTTLRSPSPVNAVFYQAASEAGWTYNADFNGPTQEGYGPFHVTQINGERCSAARAFLHPVLQRDNLTVFSNALTQRVLLQGKRASGVEIRQGQKVLRLQAGREVILCAGAINSPQLLLLSGIGPAEELARHGIAVNHALPGVGKNLQDHQDVMLMYRSEARLGFGIAPVPSALLPLLRAPFQYLFGRRGPMTSNTVESGAFLRLDADAEAPQIGVIVAPALKNQPQRPVPFGNGITLHVGVMHPKSRGEVRLQSANPADKPLLDSGFLSHPDDLDLLVRGVEAIRSLVATPSFARHLKGELIPGEQIRDRAQIEAWIRSSLATVYHPVGTCKMGHDEMAVVDDQLRVQGIDGLRVADASIMPTLITGNTNAPAIMIGEKAADLLLGINMPQSVEVKAKAFAL
ncbi:GMC family oxidoreductase [Pseudomonas sp. LRF_L74]|uniref:GMC family oxidoreductase n=1 Tax=Pseudomonas sp. LRF_L74 TaxID=3369422 RepID=UPI003F5D9211